MPNDGEKKGDRKANEETLRERTAADYGRKYTDKKESRESNEG